MNGVTSLNTVPPPHCHCHHHHHHHRSIVTTKARARMSTSPIPSLQARGKCLELTRNKQSKSHTVRSFPTRLANKAVGEVISKSPCQQGSRANKTMSWRCHRVLRNMRLHGAHLELLKCANIRGFK
eukprot:scpid21833/ scgid33922/ 